jgi:hypothetical protein
MDNRKHVEVCFTPGEYAYYKDEFEIVVVIGLQQKDLPETSSA